MSTVSAPIIVVGSANQDYIVRVPKAPAPGETLLATDLVQQPGGKGANQAVAAARLRGNVTFVASVGDDADGASLIRELRSEGVDASNVEIISRGRTGIALVSVYDSGENSITVVPGTNFALTASRVTNTLARVVADNEGAVVVTQAETRSEIIGATLRGAEASGARAILNLAPYQPIENELLALCDPLVVNESEASDVVGWTVDGIDTARRAAAQIGATARSVVITIGAQGAYWYAAEGEGHIPAARPDRIVDTTGAGDAFVGALAAVLARGESLEAAVRVGVRAGTFAVQSRGAQSSYALPADLGLDETSARVEERI